MPHISIDRDYLLTTLTELVRIDSVNSDLVPGAAGEGEIAVYLAGALSAIGIEPIVHPVDGGRSNVVGVLKGKGGGRSLMLNAHTDTVGVTGMADPFSAEVRDGMLYGRGAYDMKASIAACLAVMKAFVDVKVRPAGDVLFTAVIDEEYGSLGTEDLLRHYNADAAIITEPTGLRVCCAHRGFVWISIETIGRAAHGSRYMDGIDANMMMGRLLVALDAYARALLDEPGHLLLGSPSLHAPILRGGVSQSVYAANCYLELERRTLPGETVEGVMADIQAIVDALAAQDPSFKAEVKLVFSREAFEVASDAPIVQVVRAAAKSILGIEPVTYGELWWMDSALLAEAGIETVIIGPSGGGAHADVEWVEIESAVDLAHILTRAVLDYCGSTS